MDTTDTAACIEIPRYISSSFGWYLIISIKYLGRILVTVRLTFIEVGKA